MFRVRSCVAKLVQGEHMLQTSDILHLQFGTGKQVVVSGKSIVLEDYWELRGEMYTREK